MSTKSYSYILVMAPVLVRGGKSTGIESDLFSIFQKSLREAGRNYSLVSFSDKVDGSLVLDCEDLKLKMLQDPNAIIFIDGNFPPGVRGGSYPAELVDILRSSSNPKVCLLPDLLADNPTRYQIWVEVSNIIIGFQKIAVDWANSQYATNKFVFFPNFPIVKCCNETFNDFIQRPYDLGYVGSKKGFRMSFLERLLQINKDRFAIYIPLDGKYINSHDEYLEVYKKCKYIFVTRAAIYESLPAIKAKNIKEVITNGRFAGRVTEALAAGCIPLYWEPKHPHISIQIKLLRLRFTSKKLKFLRPFFLWLSGNPHGWPFDTICEDMRSAVAVARDPHDALMILSESNLIKKERWEKCRELYEFYSNSDIFFQEIECLISGQ